MLVKLDYNAGVSPRCLAYFQETKWSLAKFETTFDDGLSINYYFAVLRPDIEQKSLEIVLR